MGETRQDVKKLFIKDPGLLMPGYFVKNDFLPQNLYHCQEIAYPKTNVSVNSKPDHSPRETPRGFANSSCPWGRVFAPLPCPAGGGGSSIILKKSAIFAFSFNQMSSSVFYMFIYARSEQCDLGPIYTITNTEFIL